MARLGAKVTEAREQGCPKHGKKYLVIEPGGICYCAYPTPDDKFSKCFYHPGGQPNDSRGEDLSRAKPDVFKSVFSEWGRHREQIKRDREKAKKKWREKKEELSYI